MKKLILMINLILIPGLVCAAELFHDDVKVVDGIDVR